VARGDWQQSIGGADDWGRLSSELLMAEGAQR
jgi:hypothetical protein